MSIYGQNFLINGFEKYPLIIGGCIQAFISCERKKRELINNTSRRRIISPDDKHEIDAQLCVAYTVAQNEIFRELLFFYLMHSELKSITEGVVIKTSMPSPTKKKTKKVVRLKGGNTKISKKRKKNQKKKIESASRGGGKDNNLTKLRSTISLLLLFSLKANTEFGNNNVTVHDIGRQGSNHTTYDQTAYQFMPKVLDQLNKEQMHSQTLKYGPLQKTETDRLPLQSQDLLKEYYDKEDYYLYQSSKPEFHTAVTKHTLTLYNDAVYPVYQRLLKTCDIFIDKSSDTNPAELASTFFDTLANEKEAHEERRGSLEQKLMDENRAKATETTQLPDSLFASVFDAWYTTNAQNDVGAVVAYTQKEKEKMIATLDEKNSDRLYDYDKEHESNIAENMINEEISHVHELNRKKYLSAICRYSIKRPLLVYNETTGTLTFNDFLNDRLYIQIIIRNVLIQAKRERLKGDETDEKATQREKQVEMAKFLSEVLLEWDNAFIDAIIEGHVGKNSLSEFLKGFKDAMKKLESVMLIGSQGNPDARKEAKRKYDEAMRLNEEEKTNRQTNNVTRETIKIHHDDDMVYRELQAEINAAEWEHTYNEITQFVTVPSSLLFSNFRSMLRSIWALLMIDFALPILGLLIVTYYWRAWCPVFLTNYVTNWGDKKRNSPVPLAAVPLITYPAISVDVPAAEAIAPAAIAPAAITPVIPTPEEFVKKRPEYLFLKKTQKKKCPTGYSDHNKYQICIPTGYGGIGTRKLEVFLNWYLSDAVSDISLYPLPVLPGSVAPQLLISNN